MPLPPTGRLHRGHALSALIGWSLARAAGGQFRLRIEDIDTGRCRPEYTAAITDDLAWLGIDSDGPVLLQSTRHAAHDEALARLQMLGVVYHCACTRADIAAAASAPHGPNGPIYSGSCRDRSDVAGDVWRLDVALPRRWSGH